jgi:hydroxymethylbilane synthase
MTVGTRGSALALKQTQWFVDALKKIHPGLRVKVQTIVTSGDKIQDRFLASAGGKGLFVKELEAALMEGEIDFAVHSCKDLPAVIPEALFIGCVPAREAPWDVLVTRTGSSLAELKIGAVVGTSSLRRRSQIQQQRPDLKFALLRGNIDTRVRKLKEGVFDAIVLAQAGMVRLQLDMAGAVELSIVPAPGQGALAVEMRKDDEQTRKLLQPLHHGETATAVAVERHVMKKLGGDCNRPMGALCRIDGAALVAEAFVGSVDGRKVLKLKEAGAVRDAMAVADRLVEAMWERGAKEIMEAGEVS